MNETLQPRDDPREIPFEDISEWSHFASCRETDPDMFFESAQTKMAKKACNRCVVVAQCLEYALAHNEREGVWGATSATERTRILARRAALETRRRRGLL